MIYINKNQLEQLGINWTQVMDNIGKTLHLLDKKDTAQPVKPYLRYKNLVNRIIAMPAYVGGEVSMAGIKWIASFPHNIDKGIKRAHSVTILNESETGVPLCIFNTALISGIRTAGVSGVMLREFLKHRYDSSEPIKVGMTGFGPIGQLHLQMLADVLKDRAFSVGIFDLKGVDLTTVPEDIQDSVEVMPDWESCYADADIFITCTVTKEAYVDQVPKPGSLHLNVSLRDYKPDVRGGMHYIIVDDWEEVCRENTDIEVMHKAGLLEEEDTFSLSDVVCKNVLSQKKTEDVVMFNPMGMAVFDIAVAAHYYRLAKEQKAGVVLED